jgi:hypothetical protein
MIRLAHELPQRLRFTVPHLRGNHHGAETFNARVRALGGVRQATVNPLTGSLIVHHDGSAETRDRIIRNLEVLAPVFVEAPGKLHRPTAVPAGFDDAVADAVAKLVAEHLTERVLRMAFAALI